MALGLLRLQLGLLVGLLELLIALSGGGGLEGVAAVTCPTREWPFCASSTDCENSGTCDTSLGVCECATGYIGPNCQQATRYQNLGNVVITQAAMDMLPTKYGSLIVTTFNEWKTTALTMAAYPSDGDWYCSSDGSYRGRTGAIKYSNVVFADLNVSSIYVDIIAGGVTVGASANFSFKGIGVDFQAVASGSVCDVSTCDFLTLCDEVCIMSDGDTFDMSFTASFSAQVALSYSAASNGIAASVNPNDVTITFNDPSLGIVPHCQYSSSLFASFIQGYFDDNKDEIASTVTPNIASTMSTEIAAMVASYQGVNSYNVTEGVYAVYVVTGLTISAGSYISANFEGQILAEQMYSSPSSCFKYNVTYADTSSDNGLVAPNTWTTEELIGSPANVISPLLVGARMTRSFANGALWAYAQDQARAYESFTYESTSGGLFVDATIYFDNPVMGIPSNGTVSLNVDGSVTSTCSGVHNGEVLAFDYTNLAGNATMQFVPASENVNGTPSVILNAIPGSFSLGSISDITSASPDVDVSTTDNLGTIQYLLNNLNAQNLALLNSFFGVSTKQIIVFPPSLASVVPEGRMDVYHQTGALAGSGYVEFTYRCACSSSSVQDPVEGLVSACASYALSKPYCEAVRRRELKVQETIRRHEVKEVQEEEEEEEMELSNSDADEREETPSIRRSMDVATEVSNVLAGLIQACVTQAPTIGPVTPMPTKKPVPPTVAPTYKPTPPTSPTSATAASPCSSNPKYASCVWELNVLAFSCPKTGWTEAVECRIGQDDILCCPPVSGASRVFLSLRDIAASLLLVLLLTIPLVIGN